MFWLGLVEATPLFAGGALSIFSETVAGSTGWAVGAILITVIICWCLRHQTPDTRIELTSMQRHENDVEREATRQV